jgi:hypothetical protein
MNAEKEREIKMVEDLVGPRNGGDVSVGILGCNVSSLNLHQNLSCKLSIDSLEFLAV